MIDKRRSARSDGTCEPARDHVFAHLFPVHRRTACRFSPHYCGRRGNIVENDLFWVGNGCLIRCKPGTSPNRRDPRVEEGHFPASRDCREACLAVPSGTSYHMAAEVGFPRHKPGDGRAGQRGPPRSQRRADDPSHGAVTWEVLDVARYITDVTAQLEALAITAHLYRLATVLGMAKVEGETIVRIYGTLLSA